MEISARLLSGDFRLHRIDGACDPDLLRRTDVSDTVNLSFSAEGFFLFGNCLTAQYARICLRLQWDGAGGLRY